LPSASEYFSGFSSGSSFHKNAIRRGLWESKTIDISDEPIKVESKVGSIAQVGDLDSGKQGWTCFYGFPRLFWEENERRAIFAFRRISEFESGGQGVGKNSYFRFMSHLASWSTSMVFQKYRYARGIFWGKKPNLLWFNGDIRSQLSFGRVFSSAYHFPSFGPQLPSESSKKAGYNGEDDRYTETNNSQNQRDPFVRRLLLVVVAFVCCFFRSFYSGYFAFDDRGNVTANNKRRFIAAALIFIGCLLCIGAGGLFIMSTFRWTWGWLL